MEHILELQNITKTFGGIRAVNDCSFKIKSGSITGLIGPNGAGKTTVFNIIAGLFEPTLGKIIFQDDEITKSPTWQRSALGISRTFQDVRIFPNLTALENVLIALEGNNQKLINCFKKQDDAHYYNGAIALLQKVGLSDKAELQASDLSYGQQKLLELIRAYASKTRMLILDEPASGINPTMLTQIAELLRTMKDEGITILIIEHNMNFIFKLCDTIIVMSEGTVIAQGTPEEIKNNASVINAYLGQ